MAFGNRSGARYARSGRPGRNSYHGVQSVVLAFGTIAVNVGIASGAGAREPHDTAVGHSSWIFARSTYTNDPYTGARVAQYMRPPLVEALADERAVTSRYNRMRTVLRGPDGSSDIYYQVQAWGYRGGLDAEWERFHDAWKESVLSAGSVYFPRSGWHSAGPRHFGGGTGYGYGPGYGGPGYGGPGYGGPVDGGPGYGYGPPGP